ncbi:hypothetical protein [Streptomyces sp. NPDC091879]|jgi:hypothetical protein|uniref:hypothetical protein n=1 Tax=Streptomyces sp. NPDC091879 TaxID=3366006 RepID=UPI00381A6FA0
MRRVQRTISRIEQPRPPWTWRPQFRTGAPRTCLSSHRDPVHLRYGGHVYKVGQQDWLLRLYQHVGITDSSVLWEGYVLYDLDVELPMIRSSIDWIEYVDNRREVVFRIRKKEAVSAGREIDTPEGLRFGVPLDLYTAHEGD